MLRKAERKEGNEKTVLGRRGKRQEEGEVSTCRNVINNELRATKSHGCKVAGCENLGVTWPYVGHESKQRSCRLH